MSGKADVQFHIEHLVRFLMGTMKALVSEAAFEQLWGMSGSAFSIMPFGEWPISRAAPLLGQSVVIAKVLEHLTKQ